MTTTPTAETIDDVLQLVLSFMEDTRAENARGHLAMQTQITSYIETLAHNITDLAATFMTNAYQLEALRRVLVDKGIVTDAEIDAEALKAGSRLDQFHAKVLATVENAIEAAAAKGGTNG